MFMGFDYTVSHASARDQVFEDMPTYDTIIKKIRETKMKLWEKAYLGCLTMTGARTTELLRTVQSNYNFFGANGLEEIDPVKTNNYNGVYDRTDFSKVTITMKILKQKGKVDTFKKVSCIRNKTFVDPFDWLVDYMRTLPVNPTARVFNKSRGQCWWMVKRVLGDSYWNHFFRHMVAGNDVSNGINISLVQSKLGHKTIKSMDTYLHMRTKDLDDSLRKVYGDKLEKYPLKSPGPLAPRQYVAAIAASNQIGERREPPYYKREAIIQVNDKQIIVPMPQNTLDIRNRIRAKAPHVLENVKAEQAKYWDTHKKPVHIKTQKELENDMLVAVV